HDRVVADDLRAYVVAPQGEQQAGRGGPARHGDRPPGEVDVRVARDDERADAAAERPAGAEQHPVAGEVAVGVVADLGDVELAGHRRLVQGVDVHQLDL